MKYPPSLNPLRGTQLAWLLPLTWALFRCAAITAPVTLEVFLHRNFGARTGGNLLRGFFLLLIVTPILRGAFGDAWVPVFPLFIVGYVAFAVGHFIHSRNAAANEHMHSFQNGEPAPCWDGWSLNRQTVRCWVEPAYCILLSLIVMPFDSALAVWIGFATLSLFIREQWHYLHLRTQQLDALDGRLESTERAPRPRAENEAFVEARPAPPRRMQNTRPARRE